MMSDETQGDAAGMVEATADETLVDEKTGWSRHMVTQMAESIRIAHRINPGSWCIHSDHNTPYVAVEMVNIGHPGFSLIVSTEGLTQQQTNILKSYRDESRVYSGRPWAAYLRFPEDQVRDVLALMRDAHLSAVERLAREVKTRTVRWKWHREDFRKEFERIADVSIPEPGYMDELRDLQKEESSPPISAMYCRAMIDQMAASILAAHELSASCWSLFEAAKRIVLNVGQETVGGSNKVGKYDFVVNRNLLTPEQVEWASTHLKPKPTNEYPSLLFLQLPDDAEAAHVTELQEAHRSALTQLTTLFKKATLWKSHREDFRIQIGQVSGLAIPQPGYLPPPSTRYWKISPGANAVHWDQFQQKSVIAVHWLDHPADLRELPDERSSFVEAIIAYPDSTSQAANALWEFAHTIKPGDRVLAYGNKTVLGFGTVTGEYESSQDDLPFPHRRAVEWESVEPRTVTNLPDFLRHKLGRNATTVQLTATEYAEVTRTAEESIQVPIDPLSHVRDYFEGQGLHCTDSQIATFYTALQTKGFVVLSGISGTGKSKIAQHFVELLPNSKSTLAAETSHDDGLIRFTLKPYTIKYNRVVLPASKLDLLPAITPGQSIKVPLELGSTRGIGRIENRIHTNGTQLHVLYFRKEFRQELAMLTLGSEIFLDPEVDDDGESLSRIKILTQLPPQAPTHDGSPVEESWRANHLFLSVRPDWRDSTSLLGYFNPLTERYQWTDFLRFILRAAESYTARDGLAWFVILDEMNLAHVEYYFADLLSVIESGRGDDGFSKEPLRTSFPTSDEDDEMPPREIYLPPSLYVIGTVNMDETTHAFSPKVLDRAFTIELTEVDFEHYPSESVGAGWAIDEAGKRAMLAAFTRNGNFAQIDKVEVAAAVKEHPEIRDHLQSLNTLLKRNRFHFGYRIFDEIAQYLHNNDRNGLMTFPEAFDQAVFMKVLPKFTGSKSRLRTPLLSLLAWAIDPALPLTKDTVAEFDSHLAATSETLQKRVHDASLPSVAARALQLLETLETDGFVSFG